MATKLARGAILIGQCMAGASKNTAKVRVKRMKFDSNLNMYFSDYQFYCAHDPDQTCKVGDIVLIKELTKPFSKEISHSLMKIVYQFGDITDPITGKKCVVSNYRDHIKNRNEIYGVAEDGSGGFDYDAAPDRGWQENKRDYTHKEGYIKYHEFEPGHPLHNDKAAT